jgi:sulfotransferase family protein
MLLPPMDFDPIFLGGEGRSGTTLLRVMLDAHSAISCGPETHFLVDEKLRRYHHHFRGTWWKRAAGYGYTTSDMDDMVRDFVRSWFETYMRRRGKRRWADKTPQTIHVLPYMWELFPTAKFVHLIRDGRDVACSIIPQKWGPNNVKDAAARWRLCVELGVKHRGDPRYMEVRYEDLVHEPERELRRVLDFVGEPFEPQCLEYWKAGSDLAAATESSAEQVARPVYTSSIGRWKKDLTPREQRTFTKIAGETLAFLGYAG